MDDGGYITVIMKLNAQRKLVLLLPRRCIYNHVKMIVIMMITMKVFMATLSLFLQVYPKGLTVGVSKGGLGSLL